MKLPISGRLLYVRWIPVFCWLFLMPYIGHKNHLFAQNELDFDFEFLGGDCGISNISINAFQHDKRGFLWIGTGDGLNRFDGKNFKIFRNIEGDSTSLIDDFNQYLALDPDGELWVSYRGKGLSKFDNNCQCFRNIYNIAKENPELFNYGFSILRIEADSTIWIGGNTNGLNLLDLKTSKIKHWDLPDLDKRFSGTERQGVNSVYQIYTRDGHLFWLITGSGLYTFDKTTEQFKHWSQELIDPTKNRHDFLVKMEPEGDFGFWLASNGGRLFYFDFKTGKFSSFRDPVLVNGKELDYAIYSVLRKSTHELWVIIASRGIGIFNTMEKKFYFPDETISNRLPFQMNSAYLLYTLPNGVIYGAAPEGLIKLNPHSKIFNFKELKIKNSQYSNQFHFSEIFEDTTQHSIYFATLYGNGFNVMNTRSGEIENYPVDYSKVPNEKFMKVYDATQDHYGNIWVVGNTDVYEFKAHQKQLLKLKDPFLKSEKDSHYIVSRIIKDRDGVLWVLTNRGGLHTFDPVKQKMSLRLNGHRNKYHLPEYIQKMECSQKGQIWLGTKNQIVFFDKKNMQAINIENDIYKLKMQDGFSTMAIDTSGHLWVSVYSGGLLHLAYRDNQFDVKILDKTKGLPNDKVYQVCIDHLGYLWISTIKGVYSYNPQSNYFRHFGKDAGMEPNTATVRFFPDRQQKLFMAVPGKFSKVNFDALTKNLSKPLLYIEKFTVQNKERVVPFSDILSFILQPTENYFSLEFSCIDFFNQSNHRFSYILEGWDPEWVDCGNRRFASYSNLNGGQYIFKVKVAGDDGQWSDPLQIPVYIDSPFYKKTWFVILTSLFFSFLIYALYLFRIRQIESTERMKTEFNRQLTESRMEALRAQMNPHFIFNCLNSINRYIVKSDVKTSSLYLTRFAKLMRLILDNSEHKRVVLSNELEALRLYIEMEALRFDHKFSYDIYLDPNVDADQIEIPPLIIQPYVENAIWHGLLPKEANGHLSIRISMKDENLELEISDNGIGRAQADAYRNTDSPTRKSMGMKLTEERLKLAADNLQKSGSLKINDLYDDKGHACGTQVILTIPV